MSEQPFDLGYIDALAQRLDVDPIADDVVAALLDLAGDAARDSGDRRNAPISCFLVGLALGAGGQTPSAEAVRSIP